MSADYETVVNQRLIVAGVPTVVRKTIAFTGAAGLGAQGAVPLFTLTGSVFVEEIGGVVTEDIVSGGSATLALGVTGATGLFIAATAKAQLAVATPVWVSTTGTAGGIVLPAGAQRSLIAASIIGTVATADITDGTIVITVRYFPHSADGALVAV